MARLYRYVVTVRGSGSFPVDMLRYDQTMPATEPDSSLILARDRDAVRTVQVARMAERSWLPTFGRWRSFGWQVVALTRDGSPVRDCPEVSCVS